MAGKHSAADYDYVTSAVKDGKSIKDIFGNWPGGPGSADRPTYDAVDHLVRRVKTGGVYIPVKAESPVPAEPDLAKISRETREKMEREFDKKALRQFSREAAQTDRILEALYEIAPTIPKATIPRLKAPASESRPQTAISLLSDLHIGAHVDPEEVGGLGEYSYAIFRERMGILQSGVRSITAHHRKSHPVDHLVLPILGDLVENVVIFKSQPEQVDLDLMAQVLAAIEDLSAYLLGLLDTFQTIFVPCVVGNHGRIGDKGAHKKHLNWDYLICKVLEMKLAPYKDRITFAIPKSPFLIVDIEGFTWLLRHGDAIPGGNSLGIPFYGLQRSVGRWIAILARENKKLDYAASGHLHQMASLPFAGVESIINGSVVGTTDFSVQALESFTRPQQFMGFVHPAHGLAARYYVNLDKPRA